MERKNFGSNLPNFIWSRNLQMKEELPSSSISSPSEAAASSCKELKDSNLNSSFTNNEAEENVLTRGSKTNERPQTFFSPSHFPATPRRWCPSPNVKELFTPQRKKIEPPFHEMRTPAKLSKDPAQPDDVNHRPSPRRTFPFRVDSFSPATRIKSNQDLQNNLHRNRFDANSEDNEIEVLDSSSVQNMECESFTGENQDDDIDEQHLSSDSEPKTLPIERSYTMKVSFPFSKQVHSLTDEIRLAVDQTQSRMFDENSALRKKLTLYEQQAQRLESQFINISTAQSQTVKRADQLITQNENMRGQLSILEERRNLLEDALRQKEFDLEDAHSELDDKANRLQLAMEDNKTLEQHLKSSEDKLTDLRNQVKEVSAERDAVSLQANQITLENEKMFEELNALQEQVASFESQLKEKEFNLGETKSDLEEKEHCLQIALDNAKTLEQKLKSSEENLGALQNQFDVLSAERSAASLQANLMTLENENLNERLTALQEQVNSLEARLKDKELDFEETMVELRDKERCLQNAFDNVQTLRQQLKSSEDKLDSLEKQNGALSVEFSAVNEKCHNLEEQVRSLNEETSSLKLQTKRTENESQLAIANSRKEFDKEVESHKNTKRALEDVTIDMKSLMEDFEMLNYKSSEVEDSFHKAKDEKVSLEKRLADVKELLDCEKSSHIETKSHLDYCQSQLKEVHNQHSAKLKSSERAWNDARNLLESQIKELQAKHAANERNSKLTFEENLTLQRQLEMSTTENLTLKTDLNNLMEAKLKCEESIKTLFEKADDLEQQYNEMKEVNRSLSETLSAYEDHIIFTQQKFRLVLAENKENSLLVQELSSDVKKLQTAYGNYKRKADLAENDLKDLNLSIQISVKEKRTVNIEAERKSLRANSEIKSLTQALNQANDERSAIESAYRSVSTELEELKAQQRTYTEKCNTFKNIQEKLNEQHIELKSKITAANQQILDLKRQNRSLETQVSLSSEEVKKLVAENSNYELQLDSLRYKLQKSEEKAEVSTINMENNQPTNTVIESTLIDDSSRLEIADHNTKNLSKTISETQLLFNGPYTNAEILERNIPKSTSTPIKSCLKRPIQRDPTNAYQTNPDELLSNQQTTCGAKALASAKTPDAEEKNDVFLGEDKDKTDSNVGSEQNDKSSSTDPVNNTPKIAEGKQANNSSSTLHDMEKDKQQSSKANSAGLQTPSKTISRRLSLKNAGSRQPASGNRFTPVVKVEPCKTETEVTISQDNPANRKREKRSSATKSPNRPEDPTKQVFPTPIVNIKKDPDAPVIENVSSPTNVTPVSKTYARKRPPAARGSLPPQSPFSTPQGKRNRKSSTK